MVITKPKKKTMVLQTQAKGKKPRNDPANANRASRIDTRTPKTSMNVYEIEVLVLK